MPQTVLVSQLELFTLITNAIKNYNKLGPDKRTRGAVESRLERLETNWGKFEKNHDTLIGKVTDNDKRHSYFTENVYAKAEEEYLQARATFSDALEGFHSTARRSVTASEGGSANRSRPLPKISLPKFNGRYQEWMPFRDLFVSMVGENAELTSVEKLHYLKANLSGDAARLIATIPITDENYERAWAKLTARFENKRILIKAQFDTLFELKPLVRKNAQELERLRSTVAEVMETLKSLGGPVDKWDYFIVHFVSHRLDPESHEAWELRQGSETEPPTYQELDEFLSSRIRALENVDARSTTAKSRSVPSTLAPSSRQSASARALVTTPQPCSCCKGSHYVASCPSYMGKSPEQRKIFVTEKRL